MLGRLAAIGSVLVLTAVLLSGQQPAGSRFLFVWAGDTDRAHNDFLAVMDVQPSSPTYGSVIRTVPVNGRGLQPHHTEHRFSPGHPLFANGFGGNRTFRFDLTNPLRPKLVGEVQPASGLAFPHSFERLPNGNVLAAMQAADEQYRAPGGLAEINDQGQVIRTGSAATGVTQDVDTIRPYSLLVLPDKDRVISGSGRMGLPVWHSMTGHTEHDHNGFHVQLWRLSDLKLLKTVALPEVPSGAHLQPAEPRRTSNGEVLLATMRCGLFRITGFDADTFDAHFVHEFGAKGACAVPVVVGDYWVQPVGPTKQVIALDVTDPSKPSEVSKVQLNDRQWPHWLAHDAKGNRIVVVNSGAGESRIWMLTIDPKTGELKLDERFREPGSVVPGVSFDRAEWPHGTTGPAIPHGSVFGN